MVETNKDELAGEELLDALERGDARAASPTPDGWVTHAWVKTGILEIFKNSEVVGHSWPAADVDAATSKAGSKTRDAKRAAESPAPFRDKEAFPLRRFRRADGVRLVPGGSAVRRGAHLGQGVVCMPPMYVNVGAFVGARTMIDSHALVGSCAQIGSDVHLSAAAQIGGVLEPAGARPVIIEDGAFIGGGSGVYEGVLVGEQAVIGAGVILTATTPLFDLTRGEILRGTRNEPLRVPPRAVVVPGTRPASGDFALQHGLQIACSIIVKYRDEGTDAATALESALR
ncbi:MAG: 2,3,4,5-tetrahydropyridine-2-carboxylate N-succinyltransferase [Planctomycetota bacterium]|jgi:2,3,4,5-tetrahydropyridine-2-carboxylate N-succinyltransferase